MERPLRFLPHYRCEVFPGRAVVLLSEMDPVVYRGRLYLELAPLLAAGQSTRAQIVAALSDRLTEAEILYGLARLEQLGFIEEADREIPEADAAFWAALGCRPGSRIARPEWSVRCVTLGPVDPTPLLDQLGAAGVEITDRDAELLVVLTDDYLQPELSAINAAALERGQRWLCAKPVGIQLWLGPLFVPGHTACWACLEDRLAKARKFESYLAARDGTRRVSSGLAHTRASRAMAGAWIAQEVLRVGLGESPLRDTVVTWNLATHTSRHHAVIRRPQCPACGDPQWMARMQSTPPGLGSCPTSSAHDGGHRVVDPEQTAAQLEVHVSPISGIVNAIVEFDGGGAPTFVNATDHNYAHADDPLRFLFDEGLRSTASGKGCTRAQARASGLGESIERYSGLFQGDELRVRARYRDLGEAAVHPDTYTLFSARQREDRDEWNAIPSRFTWVGAPFDEDEPIEWSLLWTLPHGEKRFLPTACCYHQYAARHGVSFARSDSNGTAAGNTLEEAISQGLFEVVERDAVALWWYNRITRPGVDPASFGSPEIDRIVGHLGTIGRKSHVLDLTCDLGIPVFAAVSYRIDKTQQDIIFGLGAHLDPAVALLRAFTEHNQFLALIWDAPDTPAGYRGDPLAVGWWQRATVQSEPYMMPDAAIGPRTRTDFVDGSTGNVKEDIERCVERLRATGHEPMVLDQTRPDAGLHVAKVVVPGLRHLWPRYAQGRLYDVPVAQGWRSIPITEDELNPWHIFF